MSEGKSFWSTFPGFLTGLAAIISAVTRLIVVLNDTGILEFTLTRESTGSELSTETSVKRNQSSLPQVELLPDEIPPRDLVTLPVNAPTSDNPTPLIRYSECKSGEIDSCWRIIGMYQSGTYGVQKDTKAVRLMLDYLCDNYDTRACTDIARSIRNDLNEDVFLGKSAWEGNPLAMEMKLLYERSCDGGHALGCVGLGDTYLLGMGVEIDKVRSSSYYQRACELGLKANC